MALEDVTNAAASSSRSKETTKAVRWSTKTDGVILNKVLEEEILKPPAYFEPQTTRGNTRAERDVFRTSSERRNDARAKMDVIAKKVMDLGVDFHERLHVGGAVRHAPSSVFFLPTSSSWPVTVDNAQSHANSARSFSFRYELSQFAALLRDPAWLLNFHRV